MPDRAVVRPMNDLMGQFAPRYDADIIVEYVG